MRYVRSDQGISEHVYDRIDTYLPKPSWSLIFDNLLLAVRSPESGKIMTIPVTRCYSLRRIDELAECTESFRDFGDRRSCSCESPGAEIGGFVLNLGRICR